MPLAERDHHTRVHGLRQRLIERARAQVVRLEAADTEICDFTGELAGQRKRLDDLLDGAAVVVYRYELGPYEPPRDGEHVFTLTADDRLTNPVYQRGRGGIR